MSSIPLFSVVIPAHNQRERLLATLESIAATNFDPEQLEVVVVDDGSTDGTYEALQQRRYPFSMSLERARHASQSLTTNDAIRLARGTYVLSSAQDILFDPELFRRHLDWHERFGDEDIVVLGNLPYAPHLDVTPFMFYLVSGGYQFAYFLIRDPLNVPPNFLYAPNFSVKREVFERVGLFDEQFPFGCQDTDLGFRLARAGIRIVHDPDAVGFHNHPVDMANFCRRQQTVGRAMLHLERKHPEYEGGPALQDLVITQFLMCSAARLDHLQRRVDQLEPDLLRQGKGYQQLWDRTFCRPDGSLESLAPDEKRALTTTQALFESYQSVLGFHWAKGYVDEAVRVDGGDEVERWVRARMIKGQASIQVRRTVQRRLADYGIAWSGFSARDYRVSQVVTDLESYSAAVEYLEDFQNPPARNCNRQLILVVDEGAFAQSEIDRLEAVAEVVVTTDRDGGVLEALARSRAEPVVVISARVEPLGSGAEQLVERLFERIGRLTVLGGGVGEPGRALRYGYDLAGQPLVGRPDAGPVPLGATVPELCWIRGSKVRELLERSGADRAQRLDWNRWLCERVSAAGGAVVHVPELRARYVSSATAGQEAVR